MNKTISINIGGFAFHIEEEAYQKLYQYLTAVRKNFRASEDCEEIMNDIEQRIAEIFRLRNQQKEVVIDEDVEFVIETMGKPEDYISEGFEANASEPIDLKKEPVASSNTIERRLFRDTQNATLGGVCSGLAHYLNVDVTLVRLAFIFITFIGFGTGVLLYVVLYLVVPEAKTTADMLQMKGRSVTIENIQQHFNRIKQDIAENTKNGKFSKLFNDAFYKGVSVSSVFVKAIVGIVAFSFLIGGLIVLPILYTIFFGDSGLIPLTDSEHAIGLFTLIDLVNPLNGFTYFVFAALICLIMFPILGMIMAGAKILFNIKTSFKAIGWASTILSVLSLGFLILFGIQTGMNFKNKTSIEYIVQSTNPSNEILIDVEEDTKFSSHFSYNDIWNYSEFIMLEEDRVFLGYPKLRVVEKADTSEFEVILSKRSNGLTSRNAVDKAENIEYKINWTGNKLNLAPYFSFPKVDKFRAQQVTVELRVPKGKKIKFGNTIDRIDISINGAHKYGKSSYSQTSWIAGDRHMECLECNQVKKIYQ